MSGGRPRGRTVTLGQVEQAYAATDVERRDSWAEDWPYVRVTQRDVAARLGVSLSTVERVLRGAPGAWQRLCH